MHWTSDEYHCTKQNNQRFEQINCSSSSTNNLVTMKFAKPLHFQSFHMLYYFHVHQVGDLLIILSTYLFPHIKFVYLCLVKLYSRYPLVLVWHFWSFIWFSFPCSLDLSLWFSLPLSWKLPFVQVYLNLIVFVSFLIVHHCVTECTCFNCCHARRWSLYW